MRNQQKCNTGSGVSQELRKENYGYDGECEFNVTNFGAVT